MDNRNNEMMDTLNNVSQNNDANPINLGYDLNFATQQTPQMTEENVVPVVNPMFEQTTPVVEQAPEVINDMPVMQEESQVEPSISNTEYNFVTQQAPQMTEENVVPVVNPMFEQTTPVVEQTPEVIDDIPVMQEESQVEPSVSNLEYNFNFETQEMPQTVQNNVQSQISPEVNSASTFDNSIELNNVETETATNNNVVTEQVNEQGKTINHELLKNLAQDTNNLINPDMINPLGRPKEENVSVPVEEPKVDYDKINAKKNYVFMAIIFIIIIAFILLLPTIISIIGI